MDKKKLSKVDNLVIASVSSLGTIGIYCTGVNLSKESNHHTPIFIATVAISFISPYLLNVITTKIILKLKKDEKEEIEEIEENKKSR